MAERARTTVNHADCRGPAARRQTPFAWLVSAAMLLIASASGCQHQAAAEKRLAYREENLRYLIEAIERNEKKRRVSFDEIVVTIGQNIEDTQHDLRENSAWFAEIYQDSVDAWRENQPAYRETAEDLMRGRPEDIEPYAIIMFL